MKAITNISNNKLAVRSTLGLIGVLALAALLSACAAGGGGGGGNVASQAKDSYQATWNAYLADSIAANNAIRQQQLDIIGKYQLASITDQNAAGSLKQTTLAADRTQFDVTNNNTLASAISDFDIQMTFVNGDTDTRTCEFQVVIEQDPTSKLWYVVNPEPLATAAYCKP